MNVHNTEPNDAEKNLRAKEMEDQIKKESRKVRIKIPKSGAPALSRHNKNTFINRMRR